LENNKDFDFINNSFSEAIRNQYSFALWRLPNSKETCMIFNQKSPIKSKPIFNEIKPGFVISPFVNPQLKDTIFIECENLHTFINLKKGESSLFESNKSELNEVINFESDKQYFEEIVNTGIDLIKEKTLKKIVFSRCKSITYPNSFNPINHFIELSDTYQNTFVSLYYTPESGAWIGATPESLISLNNKGILKTVALAGTQKLGNITDPKQAIWRQKEIEEQALVSRYIIECFKKVRVREYDDIGPRTIIAGDLMHLKTDFSVDTVAIDYPYLGTSMLELLHPTSAVCGMPKDISIQHLLEKELYNRQYFSGFIGPININHESNIFVNIRCMQLCKNKVIVYAGAGITEDSIPENEWQETEMKMKTIQLNKF
jgi:isochorismate synthase